jgi:inhibitor of KinA sporulation pathway (predicted exonuclease)
MLPLGRLNATPPKGGTTTGLPLMWDVIEENEETAMRYILVDLEATCWEKGTNRQRMEIIEIGAVQLDTATGPLSREFSRFVRPVAEPQLSPFCVQLTGIQQADVDSADPFSMVFDEFVAWIGEAEFMLCSWGAYDLNQLRIDCLRHGRKLPDSFERHLNLKKTFSHLKGTKPLGMQAALRVLGLPLVGQHHRAIDDVRNIAQIALQILPGLLDVYSKH